MSAASTFDLQDLARLRTKGKTPGIYSVCSAHPWVLEAAMKKIAKSHEPLLIEATCNQVNQFGGYTGMTPQAFREYVFSIAARVGFPQDRILLGGDHLGPYPWRHLPASEAMQHAADLVAAFAKAGFTKIHLDASMACKSDPVPLPDAVIAERAARLAKVAEGIAGHEHFRYVIGTEVPVPGGSTEELAVCVTQPSDAEGALTLHKNAFASASIDDAWTRVVALVVQPGVEFGHEDVVEYDRPKARQLCALLDRHPSLIFEAHSTDYQRPEAFVELVKDGFAILKVGPALTYAMRQAIFALLLIEKRMVSEEHRSHLEEVLQQAMIEHPEHWREHYSGEPLVVERLRIHSYSDRIRYYWTLPAVTAAVTKLLENLDRTGIPETLLSDYLPIQYVRVRNHELENSPVPLILDKIGDALEPYIEACGGLTSEA
jgi:D-tagatose-1,6-bisphosphate aldolase subunit GatZ/KbaZ